mgnify:CR=1 FL=1
MTDQPLPAPAAVTGRDTRGAALAEFWHYFSMNRGAVLGLIVFVLLVLVAIFAPLLAPLVPMAQPEQALAASRLRPSSTALINDQPPSTARRTANPGAARR